MAPWNRQGNKRKPENSSGLVNILQTYAQTPEDVELFLSDSSVPLSYLKYSEVLAAFPSGNIPQHPFDCKFLQWQVQSSTGPGSKRTVHLAVLLPASRHSTPDHRLPASNVSAASNAGLFGLQDSKTAGSTPNSNHSAAHFKQRPRIMASSPADKQQLQLCHDDECSALDDECALQQYNTDMNGSPGSYGSNGRGYAPQPNANGGRYSTTPFSNGSGPQHYQQQQHHNQQQQQQHLNSIELERRKFTRNLLSANNKKESLERYKAIMSLIEACKRRLAAQLPAGVSSVSHIPWGCEPGASLMQAVLDVGEALASFGNCHFPEHSNEARAILAGDYRALLRQYLSHFGFMFAQPMKEQLSHDLQEEVQSVGSLLATRCEAYDLLYDQLVKHVGLEGRGGPSTIVLNHNNAAANPTTSITANPTNTTTASASSKSKAVNQGLGGAAIAAAGLVGLLMLRAMRSGGGGGGRGRGRGRGGSSSSGSGGSGGSSLVQQQQRPLRIPKGKNGRELLLVSQLSACGDELRRARHNDELLKDDWRLGRHVRLAWPPGPPEPPGYQALAPDACNVSNLLQEMYG